MSTKTKPAATAIAAGSIGDAFSWQATHSRYVPDRAARQDTRRIVTRQATWAGRPFALRFDLDDPNWRVRALAALDPNSDAAYAVRAFPRTRAEREAFALWAELELQRMEAQL